MSNDWPDQWVGTAHMIWQVGPPYMPGHGQANYTLTAEAFMTFSKRGDTYPDGLEDYHLRDATINYLASGTVSNGPVKCNIIGAARHYIDGSKEPATSLGLAVYGPSTLPSSPDNRIARGRVIDGETWQRTQDCGKYGTFQFKEGSLGMFFDTTQKTFYVSKDYMSFIDGYDDPILTRPDGSVKVTRSWDLQFKKGGIAPDINPACPNRTITFRPIGSPPLGPVTWSCDGNPATGTGTVFRTRFDTPGDHTVKATETTQSGTRTASTQVHITEPSGEQWKDRFGHSTSPDGLQEGHPGSFQQNVKNFLAALRPLIPHISSTWRTDEHQYLMYHSRLLVDGTEQPADVPAWPGVDICWDHHDAEGRQDVDASRAAAQAMVKAMHVGETVAKPGRSNHRDRIAIDLAISWEGDVTLDNGKILKGGTGIPEEDAFNTDLAQLGKDNGVIKNKAAAEWMHWSINGK